MGSIQMTTGTDSLPRLSEDDTILLLVPSEPRPAVIERLKTKFPGVRIRWQNVKHPDKGFLMNKDLPLEVWEGVTILLGFIMPDASLLPKLRFVQLSSAGADQCADSPLYRNPEIPFCSANGAHPPQIAEWVIGTWLSHQHQFPKYRDHMNDGYWEPTHRASFQDSQGLRMGILGYGAIGRQCANLARALGMDVVAFTMRERLTAESRKDDSYCVPGTGDPDGLIPSRWFHGTTKAELHEFLGHDIDILVVCLPLTSATRNILSKGEFEILSKRKTFLSNVARGGHVNTDDLIDALERGLIRGAALDVTNPEPLPQDHRLWKAPNLLITPHNSWISSNHWGRVLEIFERNLTAFNDGTELINKINKDLHY